MLSKHDLVVLTIAGGLVSGAPVTGVGATDETESVTESSVAESVHSLWKGEPPGMDSVNPIPVEEELNGGRIRRVSKPTITLSVPDGPLRGAVLICPGGGYSLLAAGHEGTDVARWLSDNGIVAAILRYRHAPYRHPIPMKDVQRGMRWLRHHAPRIGVATDRIGVLGFSAGGHLAATLSTHHDAGDSDAEDPMEKISCRPDFTVLIYPVIALAGEAAHRGSRKNLLGSAATDDEAKRWSPHLQVREDTPPAFLVHCDDDGVSVENSVLYHAALIGQKIDVKFARYATGGHGFGLGKGGPAGEWPAQCLAWLRDRELITAD